MCYVGLYEVRVLGYSSAHWPRGLCCQWSNILIEPSQCGSDRIVAGTRDSTAHW